MKPARFHPAAEEDLYQAIRHYERQQRGLGLRFQQAVDQALEHIKEFPATGYLSAGETRTLSIQSFSYGIVFREYTDEFRILAVRHYHRREDYWHGRLETEQDNE